MKLTLPGSKSITNRAMLAAALAKGKSEIKNALDSDDTAVMTAALKNLGIKIKKSGNSLLVSGGTLKYSKKSLYCGNSGTTMRFLGAVLATQPFESILDGNKRMRKRPIKDLADALNQLGARVITKDGFPPITILKPIRGGECFIKGNISSQFLSGLLLAAPLAKKPVTINIIGDLISKPYVDLTIDVMKQFGVKVKREGYKRFFIASPQKYKAREFLIEGDASSASYFWGISALAGEKIEITNIPKNSLQPDADLFKKAIKESQKSKVKSGFFNINCANFPDGAMTLAIICAFTKGKFVLNGLSNLRVKECDRLHALATELNKIGCKTKELRDGLEISGDSEKLHGAKIETYSDHRIAMCFGMASIFLPDIKIKNPGCVRKTYPNFWKDLKRVKKHLCDKNIILTGMRGSGKTRLGRLLAKKLKRRFIDIDAYIEKISKKRISKIVKEKGWKYFRALESKTVKSIAKEALKNDVMRGNEESPPEPRRTSGRQGDDEVDEAGRVFQRFPKKRGVVIATGGGTLMCPENAKTLKQNGKVIFLQCPVQTLQKRIKNSLTRPSLTGKPFTDELAEIYKKREKRYKRVADYIFDASEQNNDRMRDFNNKTQELCKIISRWGMI